MPLSPANATFIAHAQRGHKTNFRHNPFYQPRRAFLPGDSHMTPPLALHDHVQTRNQQPLSASGEDIGFTVDRGAQAVALPSPSHDTPPDRPSSTALSDAKRYRKRAQAAEKHLEELRTTLADREQKLVEAQKSLAQLQRQRQIDRALIEAGAMDVEMSRRLIDATLGESSEADINAAVDDLKRAQPYLFRQNNVSFGSGAMSAALDDSPLPREAQMRRAATEALETGKRSDLLRYLRLRRRSA